MIFQEPMTALNPLHTIGRQIEEVDRIHAELGARRGEKVLARLADVHLPDPPRIARPTRTSFPAGSGSGR